MHRWKEVILFTIAIRGLIFLLNPSIDAWVRWDGPHYIDIAKSWYQTGGDPANFIVFYPLYPILIKITGMLIPNLHLGALIISFICSIISAILLYELALLDFNKKVAFLSVWFLNIFPTSYFLQAGYTESLFLMLSVSSVYFYRKNNYISTITGFLTSLTRVNGLLLIPFYLFESFKKTTNVKKIEFLIFVSIFTFGGFYTYLLINKAVFGEFFYFIHPLTEHWYKKFEWPWIGVNSLISFIRSQTGGYYYLFLGELVSIFLLIIFTIFTFFKLRLSYGIYMLTNLFLFTSTSFIMSTPRYALILFPIYFCLASIKNKVLLVFVSILSIFLLITLTLLYTKGSWAY